MPEAFVVPSGKNALNTIGGLSPPPPPPLLVEVAPKGRIFTSTPMFLKLSIIAPIYVCQVQLGSVTNPETGETVMVPTGGYTYNPNYNNNPYVDAVASMTPPSTPADQFNNLLRTVQGGNSNPYVQASGIASALPPGP